MSLKVFSARVALILALGAATNQAFAAPMRAQAQAPIVKEPGESAQYRALLEEAVSEYDARRYEEARALFRRAHDISPNARTLRGIGMASFELREYVEALRSLENALTDKRRPLTATQRQQVEALLERTRAFVGRFFLKLAPKETTLRIDGAPTVIESDGSLLLSFGRHSVIAEAPGFVPENREINVIGGERQELLFQLRAAPIAGTIGKSAGGSEAGPPRPPASGEGPSSAAVWWYGGAALAAAGAVGAYFGWRSYNRKVDRCTMLGDACDNRDTLVLWKGLTLGTTVAAAAGAVALGIVGTVVWATNSKSEPGTALACGAAPGAVNCELKISF
jgi:tetratricopeptide (TPR) repeat protein